MVVEPLIDKFSKVLTKVFDNEATDKLVKHKSRVYRQSDTENIEAPSEATADGTNKRRSSVYREEDDDELVEEHEKWAQDDFVLPFLVAFMIGMGNVWRFPSLCYKYGRVAFLIPYLTMYILAAYPYIYLELLVGQYAQVGTIAAFKFSPLFKGVGICMTIVAMMTSFNIQSVLAWSLFYLFQSIFHTPLPWISCDNGFGKTQTGQPDPNYPKESVGESYNWNTENCTEFYADEIAHDDDAREHHHRLPGSEYFIGRVQRMWKSGFADKEKSNYTLDNGVERFGFGKGDLMSFTFNMDLMFALFVTFLIVQIFLNRGTRVNGTFMGLLVFIPYVVMAVLLYRASGLTGAGSGLKLFLDPQWEKLADPQTWGRAAEQVFRSTGAGFGVYLTIASHNNQNRNVLADATTIVLINIGTTFISACTIFMLLGHVYNDVYHDIDKLASLHGPELVFEVMADVLGALAKPNYYSSCFYLMLFFIGLTTVTTTLTTARNSIIEVLPVRIKYKTKSRLLVIIGISVASFFQSSLNLTRSGLHTYHYLETFIWSFSAILSTALFLIAITWFWGLEEIIWASQVMGLQEPGIYFQLCWKYFTIIILFVLIALALEPEAHEIIFDGEVVEISMLLKVIGYTLAVLPLAAVLYGAYNAITKHHGSSFKQKLLLSVTPTRDHVDVLETGTGERSVCSHYFYLYASTNRNKYKWFCGASNPRFNQVMPCDSPSEKSVVSAQIGVVEGGRGSVSKNAEEARDSKSSGHSRIRGLSLEDVVLKRGTCCSIV